MKMRRMPSHPDFRLEGQSRHFRSCWELELDPGEAMSPHQHLEAEELFYLIEGEGGMTIAEKQRVIRAGEVVLVPRATSHSLANVAGGLLRCIAVESSYEVASAEEKPQPKETLATLERIMEDLPATVDEPTAIQKIVALFDIGGRLSEQIEGAFGLDNEHGVGALGEVERRIMHSVVEITKRYTRRPKPRF